MAGCEFGEDTFRGGGGWLSPIWLGHAGPMNIALLEDALEIQCAGFFPQRLSSSAVILYQGEENTRRHEEAGEVVLVTEHRVLDGGNRKGHIVIRVSVHLSLSV